MEYSKKRISLQSGGFRYNYYKIKDGKKLRIPKEEYIKKLKNKNAKYIDNKMEPNYTETLSEPWFTLILLGLKTVEGRKNKGRFKDMKIGDIVKWTNDDFMPRSVLTEITGKAEYPTFREYLEKEGLDKCLPGMEKFGIDHGLSVYFKYFTKEEEKEFGVVSIKIKVIQ